jgi:antitoxin CcdA
MASKDGRASSVNLPQACERGQEAVVAEAHAARWLRKNRDAIEAWNEYVEKNGLPLAEFRQF